MNEIKNLNFFTNIKLNDNSQYTEPVLPETVLLLAVSLELASSA